MAEPTMMPTASLLKAQVDLGKRLFLSTKPAAAACHSGAASWPGPETSWGTAGLFFRGADACRAGSCTPGR